jgi:hypothetical protein
VEAPIEQSASAIAEQRGFGLEGPGHAGGHLMHTDAGACQLALAGSASPSQVEQIVDSALKMADRPVETQYGFLKKVVHSAGEAVGGGEEAEEA